MGFMVFSIVVILLVFLATAYMEHFVGQVSCSKNAFYWTGGWVGFFGALALDTVILLSPMYELIASYFGQRPEMYETMEQAAFRGGAMTISFVSMLFFGIVILIGYSSFERSHE